METWSWYSKRGSSEPYFGTEKLVVGKKGFWTNSSPSFHEGELKWGRGSKFWATLTANFLKSDFFHTRKGKGEFFEFGPLKI